LRVEEATNKLGDGDAEMNHLRSRNKTMKNEQHPWNRDEE
jgi:hypothetical protein